MNTSKQDLRKQIKSLRDRIVQLEKNAELREDKLIKVIETIFDTMSATKQQEVLEEITSGN